MFYPPPQFFNPIAGFQLLACIYKKSGNSVDPDQLTSQKPADLDLLILKQGRSSNLEWYVKQFNNFIYMIKKLGFHCSRECSGSVVECLTRDREAPGSRLTGFTALWSLSKTHLS